jgi:hypothetical protein
MIDRNLQEIYWKTSVADPGSEQKSQDIFTRFVKKIWVEILQFFVNSVLHFRIREKKIQTRDPGWITPDP